MSECTKSGRRFPAMCCLIALSLLGLSACSEPVETLDPWPFNVEEVVLSCELHRVSGGRSPRRVFVTTSDGRRYGANGSAMAVAPRTDPIQSHYDTSAVIARGLQLCDYSGGTVTIRRPSGRQATAPTPSLVEVDGPDALRGTSFTLGGEPALGERRPKLAFSCGGQTGYSIMFDFGAEPRVPPPLRGAFASVSSGRSAQRKSKSLGAVRNTGCRATTVWTAA